MKKRGAVAGGLTAGIVAAAVALSGIFGGSAVDTAGSPLSLATAQQLKASNTTFIQASDWWPHCSAPASVPSTAIPSLDMAESVGVRQAGYFFTTPFETGQEAVDKARNGIGIDRWNRSRFQAEDVEIPDECYNAGTRLNIDEICNAMDALSAVGAPRVIYSSMHEWVDHLGNPPHCPNTYLWLASGNGNPDLNDQLFGGWTAADVIAKQYHGDTKLGDLSVDLDSTLEVFPWEIPAPVVTWGDCGPDNDRWNVPHQLWVFRDGTPPFSPVDGFLTPPSCN